MVEKESNFLKLLSKTVKEVLDEKETRDALVDGFFKMITSPVSDLKEKNN